MTAEEKRFENDLICHIAQGLLSNEAETLELFHGNKKKREALECFADIVFQLKDAIIQKKKEKEGKHD